LSTFDETFASKVRLINDFIERYWGQTQFDVRHGHGKLIESVCYSVSAGGKRFRPVLALLTAEALAQPPERVLAYGVSVEFIHTYSLIHDDLPCMDNDDMRRGLPTNHKIYGEALALLAGDALLTEAFAQIASAYAKEPQIAAQLVRILAQAAGARGMVAGQAIDMRAKGAQFTRDQLQTMHEMKTGALIASAVEGASVICGARADEYEDLKVFAQLLGLAFQVADDVLDSSEDDIEPGSYPALLGLPQSQVYLQELTMQAINRLKVFAERADGLRWIANFNLNRTH
jgi:geranylgeranyl diphosphate synthase type II